MVSKTKKTDRVGAYKYYHRSSDQAHWLKLAETLEVPESYQDSLFVHFFSGGLLDSKYSNFLVEQIFLVPPDEADWIGDAPQLRIRVFYFDKEVTNEILAETLERCKIDSPDDCFPMNPQKPFIEARWQPPLDGEGYAVVMVMGWVQASDFKTEATKLLPGFDFITKRFKKKGRPEGTGWFNSDTDFTEALQDVLRSFHKEPTVLQVLKQLDLHSLCKRPKNKRDDSHTSLLRRWLKRANLLEDTELPKEAITRIWNKLKIEQ